MNLIRTVILSIVLCICVQAVAQDSLDTKAVAADSLAATTEQIDNDSVAEADTDDVAVVAENGGFRQLLKTKFIEGNAGFMSLVAIALVLGLAFCIERLIYLSMAEINAKRFMAEIDTLIEHDEIEKAKDLCRNTRGPVASVCYQGLVRIADSADSIERSMQAYGSVQELSMERGCSWITLFIAMAPSLGFLGTVIGMVMAFEQIELVGDISPTIVAEGMKVALITTIFGIIVALILQLFYNFILSKIDHLTAQMNESEITMLDAISRYKQKGE